MIKKEGHYMPFGEMPLRRKAKCEAFFYMLSDGMPESGGERAIS